MLKWRFVAAANKVSVERRPHVTATFPVLAKTVKPNSVSSVPQSANSFHMSRTSLPALSASWKQFRRCTASVSWRATSAQRRSKCTISEMGDSASSDNNGQPIPPTAKKAWGYGGLPVSLYEGGTNKGPSLKSRFIANTTEDVLGTRELDAQRDSTPRDEKALQQKFDKEPEVTMWEAMPLFARHLWPKGKPRLRVRVVACFAMVVTGKACKVSVPVVFKGIVDSISVPAATTTAINATGGTLAISITAAICAYGLGKVVSAVLHEGAPAIFAPVGSAAANNVQLEVFAKLHSLDATHHRSRPTGTLVKEIDRASRAFSNISRTLLFVLVPTGIELALVGGLLANEVGPLFATFACSFVIMYGAFTIIMTQWRAQFRHDYIKRENAVGARLTDSLLNYKNVKYFQMEEYEKERIDELNHRVNHAVWRLESSLAMLNIGQQAIFAVAITGTLWWSAQCVVAGTMSIGSLVMVDALLVQLYHPITSLGAVFRELTTGTLNLQATLVLLREPHKPLDCTNCAPFEYTGGEVTFDNVRFKYPGGKKRTLDGCNFSIPAGKTVGIIGPSGCGKSTVFHLLFRFFDVDGGSIRIDGQDVRNVQMPTFRKHIGIIPQETVVFNGTILFNLRYARMDATDEEVMEAAKAAKLHDTIMQFPKGYQTIVGETGIRLSGGERQRLSIARVILRRSNIVLADEPTSAVDAKMDTQLMSLLKGYTGTAKTLVIVAHRLHTVQDADLIIVLGRGGRVLEQGSHQELMDKEDYYHRLWMEQHQPTSHVIGEDGGGEEESDEQDFESTPIYTGSTLGQIHP